MASRNKVTAQQAARLLGWNEQALRNHAAAGRLSWAIGVPPHDGKKGQCSITAFLRIGEGMRFDDGTTQEGDRRGMKKALYGIAALSGLVIALGTAGSVDMAAEMYTAGMTVADIIGRMAAAVLLMAGGVYGLCREERRV